MKEWEVTRLSGVLGAEVRGLDLALADAEMARALETLLHEHHVLFLPDQHPTPEAQLAFGQLF